MKLLSIGYGIATVMSVLLPSSAISEPITIKTAAGPAIIAEAPSRLAVFDIAVIDTLSVLGVPVVGAPSKVFVDYLDDYLAGVTPIGTLFEADYESLIAVNPDLIIVGGRSAKMLDQLNRVTQTIDMTFRGDQQVGDALSQLATLGQITGKEEKAAEVAKEFTTKIETARNAVRGKGNALIVLANGPKISAFGSMSRFGWIHNELNIPEASETGSALPHGEPISFEFIFETNPDWLIVIDRGAAIGAEGQGAEATLDNVLVHKTTAWSKGQVVYVTPANVYISGGGILSMTQTLDELIAAFGK